MTAVSVSAAAGLAKCRLCTQEPKAPAKKKTILLHGLFFALSVLLIITTFTFKLDAPFLTVGACGVGVTLVSLWVLIGRNARREPRYLFFDDWGIFHRHISNPLDTPKQYWEGERILPVIRVVNAGLFRKGLYGITHPSHSQWKMVDSWGSKVALRDKAGNRLELYHQAALSVLKTNQPNVIRLVGAAQEGLSMIKDLSERAVQQRKDFDAMTDQRTHLMAALARILVWLKTGKRGRSRWNHAAALKTMVSDALHSTPHMADDELPATLEELEVEAQRWVEAYDEGLEMKSSDARKDADARAALDAGEFLMRGVPSI